MCVLWSIIYFSKNHQTKVHRSFGSTRVVFLELSVSSCHCGCCYSTCGRPCHLARGRLCWNHPFCRPFVLEKTTRCCRHHRLVHSSPGQRRRRRRRRLDGPLHHRTQPTTRTTTTIWRTRHRPTPNKRTRHVPSGRPGPPVTDGHIDKALARTTIPFWDCRRNDPVGESVPQNPVLRPYGTTRTTIE